jgi:hypothetical protein
MPPRFGAVVPADRHHSVDPPGRPTAHAAGSSTCSIDSARNG